MKPHVLSIRIENADLERLKRIAELNHEKPPETARKALKMLITAYSGYLEQFENQKG